ncbi:2OG-Fe(II) oxygenase [[Flexibacter] sp. ATCC 35103]|uniref:2OG-Fe(II) oxygenase n=1 Tax=[Flexibacter] sp. ATCC 35103 TaxID=1937528 RepID=UPI0009D53E93|nr:2OG-Fe(II) oxygenase [[Flexibacter] sp. ATCC 35103]OMQ12592.1 oxidoreductase, 2OG-Fe(II) oxygenase [[Flexibacter] sp. ATCC 35103]
MVTIINEATEIYTINNFLTIDECNKLIEKSEQVGFQEAEINIDGAQTMMKMVRNNERIMYQDDDYASFLWKKLQPHVKSEVGNSVAIGLNEMFRFYKYNPGQRFKMHRDGSYKRSESEYSYYTFLIYLNDSYEGGETKFASGEIIMPKTGTALIFEHSQRHEGAALISGIKYVLRSDIMYKLKDDINL